MSVRCLILASQSRELLIACRGQLPVSRPVSGVQRLDQPLLVRVELEQRAHVLHGLVPDGLGQWSCQLNHLLLSAGGRGRKDGRDQQGKPREIPRQFHEQLQMVEDKRCSVYWLSSSCHLPQSLRVSRLGRKSGS